jgi:hypothetical protein
LHDGGGTGENMKRFVGTLLAGLFIVLLAVPALSAQERGEEPDREEVFLYFLFVLAERYEEIATLAMPDFEILTIPGREDEALFMITFNTPQDARTFKALLAKENIPYLGFPEKEQQLAVFYSDALVVIMKAVMGL